MSNVIPFGKYKGYTVAQVANKDRQYLGWLSNQPDLSNKWPSIFDEIQGLRAPDDSATPEHNRLQARFLDRALVNRLIRHHYGPQVFEAWKQGHAYNYRKLAPPNPDITTLDQWMTAYGAAWANTYRVEFEVIGDVLIIGRNPDGEKHGTIVELKPQIGDDYPNVLRQALRQEAVARRSRNGKYWVTVIYEQCRSAAVTNDQIRQIFNASGIGFGSLEMVERLPGV
jgi:hypothetical protein